MQHMLINRMMFGSPILPADNYFNIPPPPLPNHSPPSPPPLPNHPPQSPSSQPYSPHSPQQTPPPAFNASPAPSYSTYYAASPELDVENESVAVSPSVFVGWEQDGQDMLWHTPQASPTVSEMQYDDDDENAQMTSDYGSLDDDAETIDIDFENFRRAVADSFDDDDDDVMFVGSYQRPEDERASRMDVVEARVVEAETRAERAEEMLADRLHRTSCPVCTDDLLTTVTIRYPCGHLSCMNCAQTIELHNTYNHEPENRCPTCRENFGSWRNCLNVFFP